MCRNACYKSVWCPPCEDSMSITAGPRAVVGPRDGQQQFVRMKWEMVVGTGDSQYHLYIGVPRSVCSFKLGMDALKAASLEDMRKPWDEHSTVMDELLRRAAEVMQQKEHTPTRVKIYYNSDLTDRVDYGPQSPLVWMGDADATKRTANEVERRFCEYCFTTLPQYDVTVRTSPRKSKGVFRKLVQWAGIEGPTIPLSMAMLAPTPTAYKPPSPTWRGAAVTSTQPHAALIPLQDALHQGAFSTTRGGTMTVAYGTADKPSYLTGAFAESVHNGLAFKYDGKAGGVCCDVIELHDKNKNVCATIMIPIHAGGANRAGCLVALLDAGGDLTRVHTLLGVAFHLDPVKPATTTPSTPRLAKTGAGNIKAYLIIGGLGTFGLGIGICFVCPPAGAVLVIVGFVLFIAGVTSG